MAFSAVTNRGSLTEKVSDTSIAMSPSANLTVGKLVIVTCVTNNDSTAVSDGASTRHSLADSQSNTWSKIAEYTDSDGAAGDGTTLSVYRTVITTQIGTGDSITLTTSSAVTNKIISCFEVTIDATSVAVEQVGVGQSAIAASVTSMPLRDYLLVGAAGSEGNDNTKTADADYSERFDLRTGSGTAATESAMHVQTRLAQVTADTCTSTTWTNTNPITLLIAIYEVFPAVSTLSDNFNDNSISTPPWDIYQDRGTLVETNSRIQSTLQASQSGAEGRLYALVRYNFDETEATVNFSQAAGAGVDSFFLLIYQGGSRFAWLFNISGDATAAVHLDYVTQDSATVSGLTFNQLSYFRIKETGGNVYFDYSTNGGSVWTTLLTWATASTPFPVSGLYPSVGAYEYDAAGAGTQTVSIFDNYNIIPPYTNPVDTLSISESVTAILVSGLTVDVFDAISITENVSSLKTLFPSLVSDTVSITENVTLNKIALLPSIFDAVSITESVSQTKGYNTGLITDDVAILDGLVRPASEFFDDFNDNSLDTGKWVNFGGGNVVEQNQRLEVTGPQGGSYMGVRSRHFHSLIGASAIAELVDAGNSVFTFCLVAPIALLATKTDVGPETDALQWAVVAGDIVASRITEGDNATVFNTPYVPATHRWFRIREAAGTTYWDTSVDGYTWTNRYSEASQVDVSAVTQLMYVSPDADGTTLSIFDNANAASAAQSVFDAVSIAETVTVSRAVELTVFDAVSIAENVSQTKFFECIIFDAITISEYARRKLPSPLTAGAFGVNYKSVDNADADIAYFRTVGIDTVRINIPYYDASPTGDFMIFLELANKFYEAGFYVIYGISGEISTLYTWAQFASDAATAAALSEGKCSEFNVGNEMDTNNDDGYITDADLRANLRSLATTIKGIFTGVVSYVTVAGGSGDSFGSYQWTQEGKGDFDKLGLNVYGGADNPFTTLSPYYVDYIPIFFKTFGTAGYLSEFNLHGGDSADFEAIPSDDKVYQMKIMYAYIREWEVSSAILYTWRGYLDLDNQYAVKHIDNTLIPMWDVFFISNLNDTSLFLYSPGNSTARYIVPYDASPLKIGSATDFSIGAKVFFNKKLDVGVNDDNHTLANADFDYALDLGYLFQVGAADGHLEVYIGGTSYFSTTGLFPYGEWVYLAFTLSGTTLKGYVNGVNVWTETVVRKDTADSDVYIGTEAPNFREFYGYIRDFWSVKSLLNSTQISDVMSASYPTLDLHYLLNEGISYAALDTSGNENTGLIYDPEWMRVILPVENISITENISVASQATFTTSTFDAISITENISLNIVTTVTTFDAVSITENISVVQIKDASVADTISITENVTLSLQQNISAADTVFIIDIVSTKELILSVNAIDTVSVSETITIERSVFVSLFDSVSIADVLVNNTKVSFVSVFEALSIAEDVAVSSETADFSTTPVEALSIAENIAFALTREISLVETLSIAESINAQVNLFSFVSDSVSIVDIGTEVVQIQSISTSDAISITESVSFLRTIDISPSEAIFLTENIASDHQTPAVALSFFETLSITEEVVVSLAGTTYVVSVSEFLYITESVTQTQVFTTFVVDHVAITDTFLGLGQTIVLSVSDTVAVSESISIQKTATVDVAQIINISESIGFSVLLTQSIIDVISVVENVNQNQIFIATPLFETVSFVDLIMNADTTRFSPERWQQIPRGTVQSS